MSHRVVHHQPSSHIRRKPLPTSAVIVSPSHDTSLEPSSATTSSPLLNHPHVPTPRTSSDGGDEDKGQPAVSIVSTWARLFHNTWSQELCGIAVGIACFAAIIAILIIYDGKPLRLWSLGITPGALISVLVTVMDAALAVPLASGFGQMKWLLLNRQGQTLERMQQLDFASRSAAGSINLLLSCQGGMIGSAGAIIAVLMLAIGPFTQQVLKYSQSQTLLTQSSIGRAVNVTEHAGRGGSYTLATLPMRAAIYNALLGFSTKGKLLDPPYNCATGDCSWDPFLTLGVCSRCTDITHLLQQTLVGEKEYSRLYWSLPAQYNNISVLGWVDYEKTHPYSTLNVTSLHDWGWGPRPNAPFLHIGMVQNSLTNATEATALDCDLRFCLHEVRAKISSGVLIESAIEVGGSWLNSTLGDMFLIPSKPDTYNLTFLVNFWAPSALANTMLPLINGTAMSSPDGGMIYESPMLMAFWASRANITGLMTYLAQSMSVHLREISSGGSNDVIGQAHTTEPYITVHWQWLTLPAVVIFLVLMFALVLMIETRRTKSRLWKNSMLALLYHGFDDSTRRHILSGKTEDLSNSIAGMNRLAEDIVVQLQTGEKKKTLMWATVRQSDQ